MKTLTQKELVDNMTDEELIAAGPPPIVISQEVLAAMAENEAETERMIARLRSKRGR